MLSSAETTFCENCCQNIDKSKFFLHERMCKSNVQKCSKCNKPFNLADLAEHEKLEHTYIICEFCTSKFTTASFEQHKEVCLDKLIPCKYCELSVAKKEIEEHENICGATTQECPKCGLYVEKKVFHKHVCSGKELGYLNENIKIVNEKDSKMQKKLIKYGLEKNSAKKNKVELKFEQNKPKNEKILQDLYKDDIIDMNLLNTPEEIRNQKHALHEIEKMNNMNKNKKNKKGNKKKEKEDKEEEQINHINIKTKKGKNIKIMKKNNNNKKENKYINDENDDNDIYQKKNLNLHNIKFDLPPDEYMNYNEKMNKYQMEYNLEQQLIEEVIKNSLKEQ